MSYQHFTNASCEYYPCKDVPHQNDGYDFVVGRLMRETPTRSVETTCREARD